ncbi:hypothetical protein [Pontimicrobium sp. SW4]|uniref:Uncharacterized protein n=1 Tax=Pontimicrobium sp. SW4 TaxID=3153519 RepID=A0AAU7BSA3_9FLAO
MTKLFSILFANLILFQSFNIGFDDVSKLNILLEHASFHQEQYGDSFFEFIAEHYGEEFKNHSNEHKEHEDLPFKHDQQTCQHSPTIFIQHSATFEIKEYAFIDASKTFFYKDSYSLFEKHSVFQPPRLA